MRSNGKTKNFNCSTSLLLLSLEPTYSTTVAVRLVERQRTQKKVPLWVNSTAEKKSVDLLKIQIFFCFHAIEKKAFSPSEIIMKFFCLFQSLIWRSTCLVSCEKKILELSYRYVIKIESNLVFGETDKSSI